MNKLASTVLTLSILSTLLIGCSGRSTVGLSQSNPVSMGKALTTSEGIKVSILKVTEGAQAWEILKAANQFNDPPANDMQYIIITVELKNISSQKEPWEFDFAFWDLFELVGKSNKTYHTYDQPVVLPDEGIFSACLSPFQNLNPLCKYWHKGKQNKGRLSPERQSTGNG